MFLIFQIMNPYSIQFMTQEFPTYSLVHRTLSNHATYRCPAQKEEKIMITFSRMNHSFPPIGKLPQIKTSSDRNGNGVIWITDH